ncbi:hypothetical protein NDU88_009195 [Pleurodeles waltl]|uniref:Uncharacterized protein n=1 Tax=Pleurodeles waltl TaxID=8319 RepID=A0AAV7PV91_PLEWA|nr:hypothetical protein NDU88_009195 [Pleurodeles waltl]
MIGSRLIQLEESNHRGPRTSPTHQAIGPLPLMDGEQPAFSAPLPAQSSQASPWLGTVVQASSHQCHVSPEACRRGAPGASTLQPSSPRALAHAAVNSGGAPASTHHLCHSSPQLSSANPPGPPGGRAAQLGLASWRSHATSFRGRSSSCPDSMVPPRPTP